MKRPAISWRIRGLVMARSYCRPHDCFVCDICSGLYDETEVVIDHILPVSLGGSNDPVNLQLTCRLCNQVKRDRHPGEDFEHLIWAAHGDPEYSDTPATPALHLVKS